MYLTHDFIQAQGFERFEHKENFVNLFFLSDSPNHLIIFEWHQNKNYCLYKIETTDELLSTEIVKKAFLVRESSKIKQVAQFVDEIKKRCIVSKGRVDAIFEFLMIISNTDINGELEVALPDDFVEQFINSDYPYTETYFDITYISLISMFSRADEFDKCVLVKNHYEKIKQQNNWTNVPEMENIIS